MPLVKRSVEPAALCRQSIPKDVKSELECVTNNTLAGVILQLSSLSSHAEDLFGELFTEASAFYTRASKLQDRIDRLTDKVQSLDSTIEEVALHDINMRKAFRSSAGTDQQVVSRESLSKTLQDTYNRADKPPPLQDLNKYRDDGRDALKIYTDPDYFFNLWREAMQKEMRVAKEKRREQRKRERKTNPNAHRQEHKVKAAVANRKLKAEKMRKGAEFADEKKPVQNHVNSVNVDSRPNNVSDIPAPPPSDYITPPKADSNSVPNIRPPSPPPSYLDHPPPPADLPAPPPPPPPVNGMPEYPDSIPPPPPPVDTSIPPPPVTMNNVSAPPPPVSNVAPPPPPPPPPPPSEAAVPPAAQSGMAAQLANVQLNKPNKPEPQPDPRSDLLSAIRLGQNLRKVERPAAEEKKQKNMGNDVASILARRIAINLSDSESDSDDDYSSGGWSD